MVGPGADPGDPPRAVLIAALVIAVAAVGVVLGIAATRRGTLKPVPVAAVPAPQAADPACRVLLDALPQQLGDYQRVSVVQPAPDGVAAWRARHGAAAVVLRCGLDRPSDFVVGSPIQVVNSVQWFAVHTDDGSTWYAVDRPVYIALTLPPGSGPTPIQQLSDLIDDTVSPVLINPAPVG